MTRIRLLALGLAVALLAVPSVALAAGDPGAVNLLRRGDSSFDRFTNNGPNGTPSPFAAGLQGSYARLAVSSPYFDDKTSWFPRSWAYVNAHGLFPSSATARNRPGWLLRGTDRRPLFIPYACTGRRCARLAGDFTQPGFRRWWIGEARSVLRRGYAGLWIDDVNLDLRTSDGRGRFVRPRDRRTRKPMTDQAWRGAMADFMVEIRRALPGVELVHNGPWYAGGNQRNGAQRLDANPAVARAQRAADFVVKEGGFLDRGLVGGDGSYSVDQLLRWIDRLHRRGKKVILDGFPGTQSRRCFGSTAAQREFGRAAYGLISNGRDLLGDSTGGVQSYPGTLGRPRGKRFRIADGVLARSFARGMVLVAEPGRCGRRARSIRVSLPRPYLTSTGARVSRLRLLPQHGAVLRAP